MGIGIKLGMGEERCDGDEWYFNLGEFLTGGIVLAVACDEVEVEGWV